MSSEQAPHIESDIQKIARLIGEAAIEATDKKAAHESADSKLFKLLIEAEGQALPLTAQAKDVEQLPTHTHMPYWRESATGATDMLPPSRYIIGEIVGPNTAEPTLLLQEPLEPEFLYSVLARSVRLVSDAEILDHTNNQTS